MNRRNLIKFVTVSGASLNIAGLSQAATDASKNIEIKKVAGSSQAIAISWEHDLDGDFTYDVHVGNNKVGETADTNYRITDLDDSSLVRVTVIGHSTEGEEQMISGETVLTPERSQISTQKTEKTLPTDVNPNEFNGKPTEEELREIFKRGNRECK